MPRKRNRQHGGQSEELEQKRPDLLSHPTDISERWQEVSVTPSGHKLLPFLLLAVISSISSVAPFFPHLYNFLAHKYYKGYLYNTELMLLISSCSSHMQIVQAQQNTAYHSHFLFRCNKRIYQLKASILACGRFVFKMLFSSVLSYSCWLDSSVLQ